MEHHRCVCGAVVSGLPPRRSRRPRLRIPQAGGEVPKLLADKVTAESGDTSIVEFLKGQGVACEMRAKAELPRTYVLQSIRRIDFLKMVTRLKGLDFYLSGDTVVIDTAEKLRAAVGRQAALPRHGSPGGRIMGGVLEGGSMPLIVNGEQVAAEILEQEFSQVKSHYANQGDISCCERDDEFRGYANDNIIVRTLLTQEARKKVEPASTIEVKTALENLEKNHGGRDKMFEALGLEPDQEGRIRREVESTLHIEKLLDSVCGPDAAPADEELKAFYESNLDRYMTPERVRASHILKEATQANREELFETLRKLRKEAMNGGDFDAMAREHSQKYDPNGKPPDDNPDAPRGDGVDLGFFGRGELPPEFEMAAYSMNVGEVSPVFGTMFGFHLLKVTGHRPPAPMPLEEIRDSVVADLLHDRRQGKIKQYVDELKSTASIEETPDEEEPAPPPPPRAKKKRAAKPKAKKRHAKK